MTPAFYLADADGTFDSQPTTPSAWSPLTQHAGPPSALLARAMEALPEAADRVIGRMTVELLGPIPVAPLTVETNVVRAGRSVALVEATLLGDRPLARASAWLFPTAATGLEVAASPLPHGPADGELRAFPPEWQSGYLGATEWRWVAGGMGTGAGTVWMRPLVPLVDDEPWSAIPRLMALVDSASGVSSALEITHWRFLNTELTVHVLRPPVGEWLCLDATTTLSSGSVGIATSHVYDERGLVARSAQALLVAPV